MKLLVLTFAFVGAALAQVSVHGTSGAVLSDNWGNAALSYGAGASYTHKRLTVGAEIWRAEVGRQRNPALNNDRRAEAVHAIAAWRVWRGIHTEGGVGVQRITDSYSGPMFGDGQLRWQRGFASAGAYYQTPGRVFFRAGYRRLFVRGDHDTDQVYTAVGITF